MRITAAILAAVMAMTGSRYKSFVLICMLIAQFPPASSAAPYNYHWPTELTATVGMQALKICNGLFVSARTLEQIYEYELNHNRYLVLPPEMVFIDHERRAVAVGVGAVQPFPTMRAAYREGFGCIVMGPEQTFDDIDALPILDMSPPPDASDIAWPNGDRIMDRPLPTDVDTNALAAAADFAFDRATYGDPSQITLSLLVVYGGDIVYERYAPGVDHTTRTRTWSAAKSIASTLVGIAVGQGRLAIDAPLPFTDWGTGNRAPASKQDPRRAITLRHVLNMSSGLYPVDNEKCFVVGACLGYFAGTSTVKGALDRGLVRPPGSYWDYENNDTLLAVYALKTVLADTKAYLEFPRRALFDRIGMHSTVVGVDRYGDFVLSSQVYTNARDLARLALLYLNRGVWNGKRILPESWIDFVATPAPATLATGGAYGGQWWLVPQRRRDVPGDAYAMVGGRGNHVVVVPSYDLVIVRRGLDRLPREHRHSPWDLTREVIKAFVPPAAPDR